MKKNVAGQAVGFQMVAKADLEPVVAGTATVYITGDGGTQATGAGTSTHEGNGEWQYAPTQAETNYDHVTFTMTLTGAVNQTVNVYPITDSDFQANVSGLSTFDPVADTVANVTTVATCTTNTDMRGTDGANTTTPPTAAAIYAEFTSGSNEDAFKADISALATAASLAAVSGNVDAIKIVTDILNGLIENSGGDRFTAKALETAAEAVWDVAQSGHTGAGSFGFVMNSINMTTTNADMTASAILLDTDELVLNQGNWLTATTTVASNAPANWSIMDINVSGEITTSNPALGGGSSHTAEEVRDLILAGDKTPIATAINKVSNVALVDTVTTNTDMRGTDSANTVAPDNAGITANGVAIGNLHNFNPAADTVANVTTVATCTTNTDMRGTDSANTVAPDNAGITANGVAIGNLHNFNPAADTVANVTTVATCTTNTDMRGTDNALLASAAPVNWSVMDINVSGEITTSNPALGGGSAHTAEEVRDLILAGDKTPITTATNKVSNVALVDTVTTNTDMRGTDSANTVVPDNAGITANGVAIGNLHNFNPAADTVANVANVAVTAVNSDMRGTDNAVAASSQPANWSLMDINGAGEITTSNPALGGGSAHTAEEVRDLILAGDKTPIAVAAGSVSNVVLVDTTTDLTNGGDDAATIYSYFISGSNEDAFKADVSLLATSASITALHNFNPAADTVAHVTLVDTTTTNTDMRGTDGANTTTPPTLLQVTNAILGGTQDPIVTDGSGRVTIASSSDATSANQAAILGHLTDIKGLGWISSENLHEITADVTGIDGDSVPTASEVAAAVDVALINQGDGADLISAIADAIASDWVEGDASPLAIVAALKADAEWSDLSTIATEVSSSLSYSIANATQLTEIKGAGWTAADNLGAIWQQGTDAAAQLTDVKSTTDQFAFTVANQVDANALTGGGGAGSADLTPVLDELSDIKGAGWVAGTDSLHGISGSITTGGTTGVNSITVRTEDGEGEAVLGAKVALDGVAYSSASVLGETSFNLDDGSYTFTVIPPSGYDTPVDQVVAISSDQTVTFVLVEQLDVVASPPNPEPCYVAINVLNQYGGGLEGAIVRVKVTGKLDEFVIANLCTTNYSTDAAGQVVIPMIPKSQFVEGGTYTIEVQFGASSQSMTYDVPDSAVATLTFTA